LGDLNFIIDHTLTNDHWDFALAGVINLTCRYIEPAAIVLAVNPNWSLYQDKARPNQWVKEPKEGWVFFRLISDYIGRRPENEDKMENATGGFSHFGKYHHNFRSIHEVS